MKKRFCLVGIALLLALASAYSQAVSLFNVVYGGTPEDVQAVINKGAKINAIRSEGTPLILAAAYNKNPEVIVVLLKAGADLNARDLNYGSTALHWAATYNTNPDVVSALLQAGADVNARNTREDMTPLIWAAVKNSNPEIIHRLLEAGADATIRGKDGKSALDYARENEKLKDTDAIRELEEASR
jgi:uncharacterized protein